MNSFIQQSCWLCTSGSLSQHHATAPRAVRSCHTNPKHARPFNALQHPKQILIWQSLIAQHKKPPHDGRAAVAARTDQGGRLFSEIWDSRRVLYPYVPGIISGQARSSRTPCEQRRRGARNGRNFLPAL